MMIKEHAHVKLNLSLEVTGKRECVGVDIDAQNGATQGADPQGAMADLMEHLVKAYWAYRYHGNMPKLILEKAANLPVDVPIPEQSRIVGSLVWEGATSILFDCALSQDEIIQFYRDRFLSQGWI